MIKGQVNEINKDHFNSFHLEVDEQSFSSTEELLEKREWNVKASKFALNTRNPIREIIEGLLVQPNPDKSFIPLSVGEFECILHVAQFLPTFFHFQLV